MFIGLARTNGHIRVDEDARPRCRRHAVGLAGGVGSVVRSVRRSPKTGDAVVHVKVIVCVLVLVTPTSVCVHPARTNTKRITTVYPLINIY